MVRQKQSKNPIQVRSPPRLINDVPNVHEEIDNLSLVKDQIKKIIPRSMWAFLKSILPTDRVKQIARERLIASWSSEISRSNRRQHYFDQKLGLNLIGDFTAGNGLGEAARSSLLAIQTTTVPFALLNYESVVPSHQRFDFQLGSYETKFAYRINLVSCEPP